MKINRKEACAKVAPRLSHIHDMIVPKKIKWMKDLIHELYDSFDEELKKQKVWGMRKRDEAHKFNKELLSYKNRTCENCKYDNFANSRCDLKRHIPSQYIEGFFCNRWEAEV